MAPNSSSQQGTAATYGSLSLPPEQAKKSSGWKVYLLAAAFGAIAVAALFMSFRGSSDESVAAVEDDLVHMFNPESAANKGGRRPGFYTTSQWAGADTPTQWTDPAVYLKHDEFDSPTKFGGKWLVHDDKGSVGSGMAGDLNSMDGTWMAGYKWASTTNVDSEGWGPCYPACGYSLRYREVVCIRSDHTIVADNKCNSDAKPTLIKQCFNFSDCHPCWEVSDWSDCEPAMGASKKTRSVECQMCETMAGTVDGAGTIPAPADIKSPMTNIGFHSWQHNEMQKAGVMEGQVSVSLTTFRSLGLTDEDVCIYGGVGVCDRTEYITKHNSRQLEVPTYFCGFDYGYDKDVEGDVSHPNGARGCTKEESIKREFMCNQETESDCDGGDYGAPQHAILHAREKGYNCNVMPLSFAQLNLQAWSHDEVREYALPSGDTRFTKQGTPYKDKYFYEMGPFEEVMDASNNAFSHADGNGDNQVGAVIPWSLGNGKDLELVRKHALVNDQSYMPPREPLAENAYGPIYDIPLQFYALRPKTEDSCINFCESVYQWSIYTDAPREKPRQFSCMNGTWIDSETDTIMQGCNMVTDDDGKTWERAPMEIQQHNTHMFCGWGLDVTPFRCCRIVQYGQCRDDLGGCYADGAIDVDESPERGDHSMVHPHSYCGLRLSVAQESSSSVFSRLEEMASVPNVVRVRCTDLQDVYECGASPNAENKNWPNEEPCVQPLAIINGTAVSQDLYPQSRCDLLQEDAGFEIAYDEHAHGSKGLPRRTTYIQCTYENCAWGPNAAIESDEAGLGPRMDSSNPNEQSVDAGFHQVVLTDWVDAYGTTCGVDGDITLAENWKCRYDTMLGSTCSEVYCIENCTSTWVCNGWGSCHEQSMEPIVNRTQAGYCYPRFFEFIPVDGDVITGEAEDGSQSVCNVPALETLDSEREECQAGCDLISFQCRQCWCMQFTSQWDDNRWTAAQEFAAVMDQTGLACYNGMTGRGTPKPTELRSCRGKACPGIWTTSKCFSQVRCDAKCEHKRHYRGVFCANRYTHNEETEHLCVSNPVGSDWELIMSMSSESTAFDFSSQYWEEADTTRNPSCSNENLDRKMHAFNNKKFDQIKMCFGYGFTLDNAGFENDDSGLAPLSDTANAMNAAEFSTRTSWSSSYTQDASTQGLMVYIDEEAEEGLRYVGLNQADMFQNIRGLRKGLNTIVKFKAGSQSEAAKGQLTVVINDEAATSVTYDVPAGEFKQYKFSFIPLYDGARKLSFSATQGRVYIDDVVITSDGFEMVGFEPADTIGRTLGEFDRSGQNSDVYDQGGYRRDMASMEFGEHWDEMMILAGGNAKDVIDLSQGSDLKWYILKPETDPFAHGTELTTINIADVRTNDLALENSIINAGGGILCVAGVGEADMSYWSLNGQSERVNMEGKADSNGCYRSTDGLQPNGVYYGDDGFIGFADHATDFEVDAPSQTLRIFVRKSSAHGSEDETQSNCVVYDFGAHVWESAVELFTAGEVLVGDGTEFNQISKAEFERVYATPAASTCGDETDGRSKQGFNLNIEDWECNEKEWHDDVKAGIQSFARWGFVTKQSDTCNSVGGANFDGAVGLGLFGHDDSGAQVSSNSGFSSAYSDASNEWVSKSTWVWVTDTSQNPAIEGIQTFESANHNKPGYTILDGAANKFEAVDQCKQKCKDLQNCQVGYYIKTGVDKGQCWLSSERANSTEIEDSSACDKAAGVECDAFEKKPVLLHVDSNAYVYETHMVLPGYEDWQINKRFATGTVFEIHDSSDKFSPVIFGPFTVREVISKQFSYGKQTYVYWQEQETNFDTLKSKDVFVHVRTTDSLEMYGLPGKVVGCLYDKKGDTQYRHPRSGRTAEAMCNELNKDNDACHGFSCWKNPNLLLNGGFEETDGEGAMTVPGWEVMERSGSNSAPAFSILDVTEPRNYKLQFLGPKPFVCESCIRIAHLLPGTVIKTTVLTQPDRDYIVSFFYTGKICAGSGSLCNMNKQALVTFETQPDGDKTHDLSVNVKGWAGAGAKAGRPYRWKHILFEVTAKFKVSSLSFEDKCEDEAMSGVLIDEVMIQAAHPGDLGDNAHDNVDHQECAKYCEAGATSDCDFTVSAVTQETVNYFNMRVDKDWFAEHICMNMDGSREDPVLCQKKSLAYSGVVISTDESGGRQHYYNRQASVKHVFGGMSDVLPCSDEADCGSSMYSPWLGLPTHFSNSDITVFTYKIEFTTGITAILNIEVTGQFFEDSVFKLLSRAKTILALREINLLIENSQMQNDGSTPTYDEWMAGEGVPPQNFGPECGAEEECKVVVPGSPVYEDTVFYFEEAAGTNLQRVRSNICIRTPVCELLGEGENFEYDPHTHKQNDQLNQCLDGLREHLDCTDPDFFTNLEASKCTYVGTADAAMVYGVPRASGNSAFKFSVQPTQGLNCVDDVVCEFAFEFGLYEFQQDAQAAKTGAACPVDNVDSEPAYIIRVSRSSEGSQSVQLLDIAGRELASVEPEIPIALETSTGGETNIIYFWADLFQDMSTSQYYVRFGRDMPSTVASLPAIQDVTIGGDILLQYRIPDGDVALSISHAAVWSSHQATFEVCSDQYRHGKMPTDHSCFDVGHCWCEWHTPVPDWETLRCNNNCGWGVKRRLVYCRMGECAGNTVDTATNFGEDCIYEFPSQNPHCRVQFFGGQGDRSLLPVETSDGGIKLKYSQRSIVYASKDRDTSPRLADVDGLQAMEWSQLTAITVEGAGCGVLLFDSDDTLSAKVEVPPGAEVAIYGVFENVNEEEMEYYFQDNAGSCPDDDAEGGAFKQNCNCDGGCSLTSIFTAQELKDQEKMLEVAFLHKADLSQVAADLARFDVAIFNENSCVESEKPETEIRCHNKRGCCVTCAYGEWSCGSTNCEQQGDYNNCFPPRLFNWDSFSDLADNYRSWVAPGGCQTSCDAVTMRTLSCEEQDWECSEWGQDTADYLSSYYLPAQEIRDYLDEKYVYQTKYKGPQEVIWIAGNDKGGEYPICKQKRLVSTASTDPYHRPTGHLAGPEQILIRKLCGELQENQGTGKKYESNFDECVAQYTVPLSKYQYAEGCPEMCNSAKWSDLDPTKEAETGVRATGLDYFQYNTVDVQNGNFQDSYWSRKGLDAGARCADVSEYCMPVTMEGSKDDQVFGTCMPGDREARYDTVECSFDVTTHAGWTEADGALSGFSDGDKPCSTSRPKDGDTEFCIQEHKCTSPPDYEYCTCEWQEASWMDCEGCGDVLLYRTSPGGEEDPDLDGVWCRKYGSGANGPTGEMTYIDCPIETLQTYGYCCAEFNGFAIPGCPAQGRPHTAKHCVAFTECTYEWHVRTEKGICDTFVKCVDYDAWNADTRSHGSEAEQESWCTSGPQRLSEKDDFITYGLGGCWLPETTRRNPNFETSLSWNNQECQCYYGGVDFYGNANIFETAFRGEETGYCTPVQIDQPSHITALHVAVGDAHSATEAAIRMKGAIYTDGGGVGGTVLNRNQPGQRVAITEEVSASGNKEWVKLLFPQAAEAHSLNGPLFSNPDDGVKLSGGRYWMCIFSESPITLWRTDSATLMDGTNDHGVTMRKTADEVAYAANSNRFPSIAIPTVETTFSGQFSVYAVTYPSSTSKPYRSHLGDCGSMSSCSECVTSASGDEANMYKEPCEWVDTRVADESGECMTRSDALAGNKNIKMECQSEWAKAEFMQLGSWSCSNADTHEFNEIVADWSSGGYHASVEECAEACYFANMHWVGWTGVYGLGMVPSVANSPESLHSGRVDQIRPTVNAFYCGGFDWKQDSQCQLFGSSSALVVDPSGTSSAGACYVPKDNPNPCNFGPDTYQWVRSKDGNYYYVPQSDGLMEYVEVGPTGPATCGSHNNVFSSNGWNGKQDGTYMPSPELTCDNDDCHECVQHMLARSMVMGSLPADSDGGANCQILTSSISSTSCDGEAARLACPSGEVVTIVNAHYGRQPGAEQCLTPTDGDKIIPGSDYEYSCWEDVASRMQEDCGGNSECTVTPSAGYTSVQDCKQIYSYIEVEYTCAREVTHH